MAKDCKGLHTHARTHACTHARTHTQVRLIIASLSAASRLVVMKMDPGTRFHREPPSREGQDRNGNILLSTTEEMEDREVCKDVIQLQRYLPNNESAFSPFKCYLH